MRRPLSCLLPYLLPLGLALATPAVAAASELDQLVLEDLLALKVSSASRFSQASREAPANVTVITREAIREHAWHTLADLLDAIPGLFVTTDRAYRYLGVRGFLRPADYNTNVLLLIDGIPVNDALYNQAMLGSEFLLDLDVVERVEFVAGPGASVYGSNAILGVINVITASGRGLSGNGASLSAGSGALRGAALRHGRADDRSDLLLAASAESSDGEDFALPGYGEVRGLDDENLKRLFAKYAHGGLTFTGAFMERHKAYPTAAYFTRPDDPRARIEDRMLLLALAHEGEARPGLALLSRLSLGAVDFRGDYPYDPPPALNRDDGQSRWWGLELQATDSRHAGHTLIYGAEYRDEYRLVQRNYDLSPDAVHLDDRRDGHHLGFYVQDDWRLADAWRLNAGVRIDRYNSFGSEISPRLGLIHTPSPTTTVKYLFGSAYRAPNAYEMHYGDGGATMKPNPDLGPERVRSLEWVVEHVAASGTWLSASVFYNRIEDLIGQVVDPADGLLVYRNVGDATLSGVVLAARHTWRNGSRLAASWSWHHARDEAVGGRAPYTPRGVAKVDLSLPLGTWRVTGEARYLGSRLNTAGRSGGATVFNLALTSAAPVLAGARASLRVDNVFDRRWADPASEEYDYAEIPREGFKARGELAWRF